MSHLIPLTRCTNSVNDTPAAAGWSGNVLRGAAPFYVAPNTADALAPGVGAVSGPGHSRVLPECAMGCDLFVTGG